MPSKHIVREFDLDLAELDKLVAELGGLAEAQINDSIRALRTRDAELATMVINNDQKLDDLEEEIEQLSIRIVALRQPMAEDLRTVIAALKISSNLERVGDYAKNIAKRVTALVETEPLPPVKSIERMAKMVQCLIHNVLDAYAARDSHLAEDVRNRDEEVDQLHASLFREILTYMMEHPDQITPYSHLLFISKNVERIGDHATNISEKIHYLVAGETISDERPKSDDSSLTTPREMAEGATNGDAN